MGASTVTTGKGYRPEVQGLRTIGAALVAVFHIWLGKVSGGVDVFFVVSGFLITGSLHRELEASHTIDAPAFWGRIARRIVPVSCTVLLCTILAALVWMPSGRWPGFVSEVFYSIVHLENFKLMANAVDYLAREEAPSPLQQFWALSVQVQFYLVWPFVLLLAARVAGGMRAGRTIYIVFILLISVASLAYSILETGRDPSAAYFNTFARVWEFGLGGLVALALPLIALPAPLRLIAGWIGLVAVLSCGFILPASVAFPGYVALWPTVGAALVLLAGNSGYRFGADRLLALKPLVALGDMSFSFYLWHWPIYIFYMLIRERTEVGPVGGLGIIGLACLAAYVTTRWLEQPVQRSWRGPQWTWVPRALAFTAPVVVVATAWAGSIAWDEHQAREAARRETATYTGGLNPVAAASLKRDASIPLRPTPSSARRDVPAVSGKCHQKINEPAVNQCVFDPDVKPTKIVALVGGSHSAHWFPALDVLSKQHGWRIVSITKSACPFEVNGSRNPSCIQWNEDIHDALVKLQPDVVFTTSTRSHHEIPSTATRMIAEAGGKVEFVPTGYLDQWARLATNGLTVVAVRDNPRLNYNVADCIDKNPTSLESCARPRSQFMNPTSPVNDFPKPRNVEFIDLTDRFCDQQTCYPVNGNVIIYSDNHHISASYSRSLAPALEQQLRQVRPDLFLKSKVSG